MGPGFDVRTLFSSSKTLGTNTLVFVCELSRVKPELFVIIALSRKVLLAINTLAYCLKYPGMSKNSRMTLTSVANIIKLFTVVIYESSY